MPEICALVTSREAARLGHDAGAVRIYMAVDDLLAAGVSPQGIAREKIIPVLDEVSREVDHERLDPWLCKRHASCRRNHL